MATLRAELVGYRVPGTRGCGTIVSVYRSTFNVLLNDTLYSVTGRRNIATTAAYVPGVEDVIGDIWVGNKACFTGEAVEAGGHVFLLDAPVYKPEISAMSVCWNNVQYLRAMLLLKTYGYLADEYVEKRIDRKLIWRILEKGTVEDAEILGLGRGATPAGDDYLAGALALLSCSGFHVKAELGKLLGKTTLLSAHLLHSCSICEPPLLLHRFILALMGRAPLIDAFIDLVGDGGDSGYHMAWGAVDACTVLVQIHSIF